MPAAARPELELQVLALNIKRLREQRKLSRREFAERVGATVRQVEHWENAESAPSLWHLRTTASLFNTTLDNLLLDVGTGSALDITVRQITTYAAMLTRITGAAVVLNMTLAPVEAGAGNTELRIRTIEDHDLLTQQRRREPDAVPDLPTEEDGWIALDPHTSDTT